MHKTDDIFNILSAESKKIKSDSYFKLGQEGLLRAFYFFRWCNKNEVPDTLKAVQLFSKGKIPEQQAEHFLTALIMIDQYETDPKVKEAIREIDEGVRRESGGKDIIELLDPPKVQRRILKNIHKVMGDGIEALAKHSEKLEKTARIVFIAVLNLIAVNVFLYFFGIYHLVTARLQQFSVPNPPIIIAVFLFVMPIAAMLALKFKDLAEKKAMGSVYPKMIKTMEENRKAYSETLAGRNINLQ